MDNTYDDIKDFVAYSPVTGKFNWIKAPWVNVRVGAGAGTKDKSGYVFITFRGKRFRAHKVAWFLMTGEWPTQDIDHRNRNRSDNSWGNLRQLTRAENLQNSVSVKSSTGYRGVVWNERTQKYRARIRFGGKRYELGTFATAESASAAYEAARAINHPSLEHPKLSEAAAQKLEEALQNFLNSEAA